MKNFSIFKTKRNKRKYSLQPKIGDRIKITYLPYNNAYPEPNCYIGTCGIVDYLYDNGGFCLNTGNSILCITRNEFEYVFIS